MSSRFLQPAPQDEVTKLPYASIMPNPTFKYGSISHKILAYSKMVNKAFTIQDIKDYFGSELGDATDIRRSINVLMKGKSVEQLTKDYWRITRIGATHLSRLAKPSN